jgi:hypothetical protein
MHRIDADAHVGNQFSEGDPGVPTNPTQVDAAILNAFQDELVNAIEAGYAKVAGGAAVLTKNTNTQLRAVLARLWGAVTPGGRLTLAQDDFDGGTAGGTLVYYQPFRHNQIALYDGTRWVVHQVGAFLALPNADSSTSPAPIAADTNYDVFAFNSDTLQGVLGIKKLSRVAWASATSRGTGAGTAELELFEGRWVNKNAITNGPAARHGLYLGTMRTDSASQLNDTAAKRHLWNAYNRVQRSMYVGEATASWTYNTTGLRQANASAANQLDFVIGLSEDAVSAQVIAAVRLATASFGAQVGIGLDSTSALATGCVNGYAARDSAAAAGTFDTALAAAWTGVPGIGRHFLAWLETGATGGSATFYGPNFAGQSGIIGSLLA